MPHPHFSDHGAELEDASRLLVAVDNRAPWDVLDPETRQIRVLSQRSATCIFWPDQRAAVGLTAATAAHRLGIAERTLRRRQQEAVRHLGANGLTHAVALALAHGLIDPDHITNRTLPTEVTHV